jgi:hypothetical protein
MPPWRPTVACLILLGLATGGAAAADRPAPVPPCADGARVPSTRAGTDPVVTVWHEPALPENWQLASCSGLAPAPDAVLIEISGRFRHDGDALSLLARLGAVSTHTEIVYWDVGSSQWHQLLPEAAALAGPDLQARRADFTLDEMQPGARLNMLYDDDEEPGPVVFETEIREAGPDGFVTLMRNVTPMTLMGFSIAEPGGISSMLSIKRVAPGEFDYYGLTAVALASMAAALTSDSDHVNRAVASYRFLAGIPGDRDPPAMLK